jgi:hypothetical protein
VCGRLKSVKKEIATTEDDHQKVARYRASSGMAYLRAFLGGKSGRHLHVDCTLQKYLPPKFKPEVIHKKDEVLKSITSVLDKKIDTSVVAYFEVPIEDIPNTGFIGLLSSRRGFGNTDFKVTECGIDFTGLPVKNIKWKVKKVGKTTLVNIRMEGEKSTTVSRDYLIKTWKWINELFMMFILGKEKDAKE